MQRDLFKRCVRRVKSYLAPFWHGTLKALRKHVRKLLLPFRNNQHLLREVIRTPARVAAMGCMAWGLAASTDFAGSSQQAVLSKRPVSNASTRVRVQQATEVVFIDRGLKDPQLLADAAHPWTEVHFLDNSRSGIEQITELLARRKDLKAIHLLSHGSAGHVTLGSDVLSRETLGYFAAELKAWGASLNDLGDLLFYGCQVAESDEGRAFLAEVAHMTGADVAGSDDLTGSPRMGGDWELEHLVGSVETALLRPSVGRPYEGVLATITVDDASDTIYSNGKISLREAIVAAETDAAYYDAPAGLGADTIVFDSSLAGNTITLTGYTDDASFGPSALAISSEIKINGAGAPGLVLSGGNTQRHFYIESGGNLTLKNLTLSNGSAMGRNAGGAYGYGGSGGGSAGLGGAIFNEGTVSVDSCTLSGNKAVGGSGSGYGGSYGGSGGGGLGSAGSSGGYINGGNGGGPNNGSGGIGYGAPGTDANGNGGGGGGGAYGGYPGGSGGSGGDGSGYLGGGGGGGGTGGFAYAVVGGSGGSGGDGGFGGGGGGGGCGAYSYYGSGSPGLGGSGGYGGGDGADGFGYYGYSFGGSGGYGGGGAGMGGAIFNWKGTLTATNCTIAYNSALGGYGAYYGKGLGGGVFSYNGTSTILNCTIAGNLAYANYAYSTPGGGVFVLAYTSDATLTMDNTIVADNYASNDLQCQDHYNGTYYVTYYVTSSGAGNLVESQSGFSGTIASSTDPNLQSLAANGGPTQTMALVGGSSAINAAVDASAPSTDQRGYTRPDGADIGAFEFGGLAPVEMHLKQGTTDIADGGSYDFGSQALSSNTDIVFTIENLGASADLTLTTPLSIGGADASQFSIEVDPTSPVSPGGTTTFTVRFTPTSVGAKTATISIANSDGDENPYDLTLTGTGTAPEMDLKQGVTNIADGGSHSFGSQIVGSDTDVVFTIENPGGEDLTLTTPITIGGADAGQFSIQAQPASPVSSGGGTTTFTVRFSPTTPGAKTATISIANNDGDENPYDLTLTGTGTVPEMDLRQGVTNIADGGSHGFGSQIVGSDTDVVFTIENPGGADLTLTTPITIGGADAGQFSIQAQPASPVSSGGGTTTFTVRFSPTTPGAKTATISIANNDGDENPYDLTLTGTGTAPEMDLRQGVTNIADGGSHGFGSQIVGSDTDVVFTIENPGSADLTLTTPITIGGADAGQFSIQAQPASPVSSGGGTTTFTVRFSPTTSGAKTATISIANNDGDENPYDLTLTGTGTVPEMDLRQGVTNIADGGSHGFGSQIVGSDTDVVFTIENPGSADLTLTTPITIGGADAGQFSIQAQPSSPVASGGGTTTFTVRFSPTTPGAKTATISIANNDGDENPYDLTLTGTGTAPEMDLRQGVTNIADGGSHDFGNADIMTGTVARTFTIENAGNGTLNLTGAPPYVVITGANAGDFAVTAVPSNSIAPAGTTTFEVTFDPTGVGLRVATVSIANDDSDENPYDFSIQGTGTNTDPVAVDNTYGVNEDTVLTVAAPGVIGNDTDADGHALTAVLDTGPANGSLTLNPDGSFEYTPNANWNGSDSFTYHVTDGWADSNVATVTIDVAPVNDPPTALATGSPLTGLAPLEVFFDGTGTDVDVGDTLSYHWDFGDGNTSTEEDPSHIFETSGTYVVTLTVSDGNGGSATSTVTVTIPGSASSVAGVGPDTDGDGFSDSLEEFVGTDPDSADSTPLGIPPLLMAERALVKHLKVALNLRPEVVGKDKIRLVGYMPIPEGFVYPGQEVVVDIGGVQKRFTLDRRRRGTDGNVMISFGRTKLGFAMFKVIRRFQGDYRDVLAASSNLGNENVAGDPRTVRVTVLFNNKAYVADLSLPYKAQQNKQGKAWKAFLRRP